MKIHILPDEIVNKIAAGEVVERPSSVVKELLENSIDAQSKHINIEFEFSGKKLIKVSDDGSGMTQEDAKLALSRHATSKISHFDDLSNLNTLGFRGEALPSIASVSRLRLITRIKDSNSGWEIVVEGGKIKQNREIGTGVGTTIEVKDLFFNTPARRKFLKRDYTERASILYIIEQLALAYHSVGFSVSADEKHLLKCPPAKTLNERVIDIFGNETYKQLIPFESKQEYFQSSGFVSRIEFSQPNKIKQYFFVNSRPVSNRILSQALYDAYRDSLPVRRHPMGIILLKINPAYIDVNIHPTKRLVKFSMNQDKLIYQILSQTIRKYLTKQESPLLSISHTYQHAGLIADKRIPPMESPSDQSVFPLSAPVTEKKILPEMRILGQIYNTYILVETPEGLSIIDQHAANERVLYEKFSQTVPKNCSGRACSANIQELLMPQTLELDLQELTVLKNILTQVNSLGFSIEEFGTNTYVLKSYPAILGEIKCMEDFIRNFISILIDGFTDPNLSSIEPKEKIIRAACRSAVKAKEHLSTEEIENLIKELKDCSQPLCCPHGRPTIIRITLDELAKKFRRI